MFALNKKDISKYKFDAVDEMVEAYTKEHVKALDAEVFKALQEFIKDADEENEPESFTKRLKKRIREDDKKEFGEPLVKIVRNRK